MSMSERRFVAISRYDVVDVENAGYALRREGLERLALRMFSLALLMRANTGFLPPERDTFACDVDESAGMAEVVDMHEFSRKVGA